MSPGAAARRARLVNRVLRVDYDRATLPRDTYRRVVGALRWLRVRAELVVLERTARGWHLKVLLARRMAPASIVALQAALGSDPKREIFNLRRVRGLRHAPAGLRDRYSVFFRRKFGGGQMPRRIEAPEGGYQRLPSLRPEQLGGNDFAVVSIAEVQDNIKVPRPSGSGHKLSLRLRFHEFPGFNYWPNATSREFLEKRLGRDPRGWANGRVVLEVVEVDAPDGPTLSLWVARPQEWSALITKYLAETSGAPAPAPATPAPATTDPAPY